MKTVLTYGTFDLFHVGHIRLLKRLRNLGDRLIVGCSTDEFNAIKGKKSIFTSEDRSEILSACKYVDQVIPENDWDQKPKDVLKYDIDIFAMGDDWAGKFDYLEQETNCTVTYLARTPDISTTQVKQVVGKIEEEKRNALRNQVLSILEQIDRM